MHRFSAALVGVVTAIAFTQIAAAADLPRKAPAYAPPPPPPVLSWTGWYVGVNAGWVDATGRVNTDATSLTFPTDPNNTTAMALVATNQFNNSSSGFLGGGQFGYNYQFAPAWLVGFEADIQGSSLRANATTSNAVPTDSLVVGQGRYLTSTSVSTDLDYLGTLRARLGVIATPSVLLYGTGGLAYGGVSSATSMGLVALSGGTNPPPGFTSGSFSGTRTGWTAGAGIEWMFLPNWSTKVEYLHYDLGSATYATGGFAINVGPTSFPGGGTASVATTTTVHFSGDIVRLGLNYKFH